MQDPFVPLGSPSFPSVAEPKGHTPPPFVPLPPLPFRGGEGNERVGVTEAERNQEGNDPLSLHSPSPLPDEGFWPSVPIAEVAEEWTIFRCASAVTIELAEELRDEHLIAWVPIVRIQRRLPRKRKTELVVKPLLPSFVFVAKPHADHAIELATKGRVHQCKRFLFNVDEVCIPGKQLTPLHEAQIRGSLRKTPLVKGDRVEILATMLYLVKAKVVGGKLRNDSYEVEIEGQNQQVIFPGFLLRKTMT